MFRQILYTTKVNIIVHSKRQLRSPMNAPPPRNFEEKNREFLRAHKNKRLDLSDRSDMPSQFKLRDKPIEKKIVTKERKLATLKETRPPFHKYDENYEQTRSTWYDPLFNPHLHEARHQVNPEEEPFNAIYADSKSELKNEYTKTRDITTPELWEYVERLARIKVTTGPVRRKANEPIERLPSGIVPPPESPPDLPYFIPRTRNFLLPVYYRLDSDPENCYTYILNISGDLWKFEEDLRTHLENTKNLRILTSVHEPDERVLFRGRHLHEVVEWLYEKGF